MNEKRLEPEKITAYTSALAVTMSKSGTVTQSLIKKTFVKGDFTQKMKSPR